jgi:hypothetical protein
MNDNITKYGPLDQRYTVPQACERIGLRTTALYGVLRKGLLVGKKLGRRTYIFESDIQAYLASAPQTTVDATASRRAA